MVSRSVEFGVEDSKITVVTLHRCTARFSFRASVVSVCASAVSFGLAQHRIQIFTRRPFIRRQWYDPYRGRARNIKRIDPFN